MDCSISVDADKQQRHKMFLLSDAPKWMTATAFILKGYSPSHGEISVDIRPNVNGGCSGTLLNRIITEQREGKGDVGLARYEPALFPKA